MTRVITIGSKKGGAGKTFITQHFAGLAGMYGAKVAVVDLCKSRNLSKCLTSIAFPDYELYKRQNAQTWEAFVSEWSKQYVSAFDVLWAKNMDKDVLKLPLNIPSRDFEGRCEDPEIHLVIGSPMFEGEDGDGLGLEECVDNVRWSINELVERHQFDYIFLDTGPNSDAAFHAALYASTDIVSIFRCETSNMGNMAEYSNNIIDIMDYREEEGYPAAYHGMIVTDIDTLGGNASSELMAQIVEDYPDTFQNNLLTRRVVRNATNREYVWCFKGSSATNARNELMTCWREFEGKLKSVSPSLPQPNAVAEEAPAYADGGLRAVNPPI